MITPILKGNQVIFGPCRLSYTHVFNKFVPNDGKGEPKYMTNVLIPAREKETISAMKKAIETAKASGIVSKWGGKEPKKLDMLYVNAKSSTRPGIVDRNKVPIVDEEEIYSGVWAIVSVTFYPYDVNGNRGVACGLNNIMKFKDDEKLGGRVSAETDFADIDTEDDEDL